VQLEVDEAFVVVDIDPLKHGSSVQPSEPLPGQRRAAGDLHGGSVGRRDVGRLGLVPVRSQQEVAPRRLVSGFQAPRGSYLVDRKFERLSS